MAMLIITAMIMVIILTPLGGWGSHLNSTYSFLGKYGGLGKIVNIDGCINNKSGISWTKIFS